MMKARIGLVAGTLAAALGAAGAQAAPVDTFLVPGANSAQDIDREYQIDRNANGTLDVGDSLRFFFSIDKLNSVGANLGGGTGNSEWTGVAQLLVVGKNGGPGNFNFNFAPDPTFTGSNICAGLAGCVNNVTVPALKAGTLIVMFQDPSNNLSLDGGGTVEGNGNTAHNGAYFWQLGFSGPGGAAAAGQGWLATGVLSDVIGALGAVPFPSAVGTVNAALACLDGAQCPSVTPTESNAVIDLFNPFGNNPGKTDFNLSGNVLGYSNALTGLPLGPYQVASNANIAFNRVPEPGTLGLLGLAFAGIGVAAARRRRG